MRQRGILKKPGIRTRSRQTKVPPIPSPFLGGRVRRFYDYKGKLQRGESLDISAVPLSGFWEFGTDYVFSGDYWGSTCQALGRLESIVLGKGGMHANLLLKGTDNPELKAWAEGILKCGSPAELSVHLCPAGCPKTGLARGSLHGATVRREAPGDQWGKNLEGLLQGLPGGVGDLDRDLRAITMEEPRFPPGAPMHPTSEPKAGADRKNTKTGDHSFKGTPLDAKETVKKCLRRRKKKKKRSKKKSGKKRKRERSSGSESNSSPGSESSRSSSGGTIDSADSGHPFREGHRVKRLAKTIPGILTRHAADEMGRLLVQHVGEESMYSIQPILLRYLRLHVMLKNPAPAQKRELLTLGHALDRLLRRDILGAMDLMMQRVKAIELVLAGSTWQVAQNLELVPLDQELITSVAEAQGAAREFRQESRVQRELGKGGGKTRWQEDPRKKGEGKKGDGKTHKGGGKANAGNPGGAPRAEPTKPH